MAGRALGPTRIVARRLRHRWASFLVLWTGLLAGATFASAVTLVSRAGADSDLQLALQRDYARSAIFFTDYEVPDAGKFQSFGDDLSQYSHRRASDLLEPQTPWAESNPLTGITLNGKAFAAANGAPTVRMAAYLDIDSHLRTIASAPSLLGDVDIPASVTPLGAASLGVKPGDEVCAATPGDSRFQVCARITSVVDKADPHDIYWFDHALDPSALLVSTDDLFGAITDLTRKLRASGAQIANPVINATGYMTLRPRVTAFRADTIDGDLIRLRRLIEVVESAGYAPPKTELTDVLQEYSVREQVGAFVVDLVDGQLAIATVIYVVLVAGTVVSQQQALLAVWRARGWSRLQLWGMLASEALLLAAFALPAGLLLGYAVAWLAVRTEFSSIAAPGLVLFDAIVPTLIAVAVATVIPLLAAAFVLARNFPAIQRDASRPSTRPWWQRRYVDIGLALLAIPLLAESRLAASAEVRTAAAEQLTIANLLLPGLAVLVVALAGLRLLPPLAAGLGREVSALAGWLAFSRLARAPTNQAGITLLVTVTIGVGVFASIDSSSETRNATDRASYQAGTDLRLSFYDSHPSIGKVVGGVPGVADFTEVFRGSSSPQFGDKSIDILAVDPSTIASVAWVRPGLTSTPITELMTRLAAADKGGLSIKDSGHPVSIWVNGGNTGALLTGRLTDKTGRSGVVEFGRLDFTGWRRLAGQPKFALPPIAPLRFRELDIASVSNRAEIAISTLSAGTQELAAFTTPTGWWSTDAPNATGGVPLTVDSKLARDGAPTARFILGPGQPSIAIRPSLPSAFAVAAIAIGDTLDQLHVSNSEIFTLRLDNRLTFPIKVIAQAEDFPTLYPQMQPSLIFDLDTFVDTAGMLGYSNPWPTEVWIRLQPGADGAAAAAATRSSSAGDVVARAELVQQALDEPLRHSLAANLLVGISIALAVTAVGFGFHFLLVARARVSEFAVLEGNGVHRSITRLSIGIEAATVLGFSIVLGTALGLALAWVLVPSLQLFPGVVEATPPTVVTVDAGRVFLSLGAVAAAAMVAAVLGVWTAGRFRLMDQLRLLT